MQKKDREIETLKEREKKTELKLSEKLHFFVGGIVTVK